MNNLKRVLLIVLYFFCVNAFSQNEKELLTLNQCLEITEAKYDFTTGGKKYYNVYIKNKCDKIIWCKVTTIDVDGKKESCCNRIRVRRDNDKNKHVYRLAMTSSTGEFVLDAYKAEENKKK